jgi:hypothetical protein
MAKTHHSTPDGGRRWFHPPWAPPSPSQPWHPRRGPIRFSSPLTVIRSGEQSGLAQCLTASACTSAAARHTAARMNHNLTTERAHLGVFSTSSYISIGDTYGKKSEADARLLGKQFVADFPKGGIAGARPSNSLFDREHKWLFGGEKYAARQTLAARTRLRCSCAAPLLLFPAAPSSPPPPPPPVQRLRGQLPAPPGPTAPRLLASRPHVSRRPPCCPPARCATFAASCLSC